MRVYGEIVYMYMYTVRCSLGAVRYGVVLVGFGVSESPVVVLMVFAAGGGR